MFIALLCALSLLYPIFITINSLPNWEVAILVLVLGGSVICDFFTLAKYRALLTADQKLYVISLVSAIAVLINTSIIIGLSLYTVDIVIVRICALLSVFFRTFVLRWYVKTNYKFIDYNSLPDNNSLGQRWNALFLQLLGQVQTGAPIILITFLTSLSMVSIYSIYNLVMVGINALLSIFISGLSTKPDTNFLNDAYKDKFYNYKINIMHYPDDINKIKDYNFDLVLAGHSHNGQIRVPIYGAIMTPTHAKKYYKPYYKINNTNFYISSGIGCSDYNFRLFNRPSYNLYRLTNK